MQMYIYKQIMFKGSTYGYTIFLKGYWLLVTFVNTVPENIALIYISKRIAFASFYDVNCIT